MTPNQITKYSKLTTTRLKKKAQEVFNKWVRNRDKDQPCINCGRFTKLQAGHFYATSTHPNIRFEEANVNGECLHCNYFNSQSHAHGYRPNLEKKIGLESLKKLDNLASQRGATKDNRFYFIEIIEKYKL